MISIIYLIGLLCKQFVFCTRKSKIAYCTILVYHSIPDDEVDRFKKQMKILKQLTKPIPLGYDKMPDHKARYSIITFDDAFKSVIKNAAPELIRLNIPFAIFIPAGNLGANPEWLRNTGNRNEFEKISNVKELLALPEQIATFGSHTISHFDLRQLDHEEAFFEIKASKALLESKLKREIKYFAFPYGAHNSKTIEHCAKAGYRQILSIIPESPISPISNFIKGRIIVSPSDWKIEYVLKILGAYGWRSSIRVIRSKIYGLTNIKNVFGTFLGGDKNNLKSSGMQQ